MIEPQRRITKNYFEIALRQYAPMIQRLATGISSNATQTEEFKSVAQDELLKCMICYQKTGSFITFFYSRLSGVFKHMRDAENRARRIQCMPTDAMANMPTDDADADSRMVLHECLGCLDEEEHHIITELFFNHRTMRDIAADTDIFPSTVSRIKNRAIQKMRHKCRVELE